MGRYKFNDEQCKQIRAQYEGGKSTVDLGKEWGCCPATIVRCIYRAGGQLKDAASLRKENKNRKLTDQQIAWAAMEHRKGKSLREIAADLGMSETNLGRRLRHNGHKTRSTGEVNRARYGMSDEQRARAVELHKAGWGCRRIGKKLGFSESTIRRYLAKQNLIAPRQYRRPEWLEEAIQLFEAGKTFKEIGAACGVASWTIRDKLAYFGYKRRGNCKFTLEQEQEIARRYVAGESTLQLAGAYEISNIAIGQLLHRQGAVMRSSSESAYVLFADQEQKVCSLYSSGQSSICIAESMGVDPTSILRALRRNGVEIRDSDSPTDTIQHLLDGTGRFTDVGRECSFYVTDLVRFPEHCKPGIAYDYSARADAEYSDEPELELVQTNRHECFALEQAVADETRAYADCPEELRGWGGSTEVRRMKAEDLAAIAIRLREELEEHGLWEFMVRYVPMTAAQRATCQQRAALANVA